MKKLPTSSAWTVIVSIALVQMTLASQVLAEEMASFATGGYATGLRTKEMMHKMDTNHDGMVSRDEWIAFQEKVFTMLDKSKTGKVHEAEYVGAMPEMTSFATGGYASGMLTKDMFKEIDVDKDGTISHEEFIGYQTKVFDMMDTSTSHKGMLGPGEYFATGGKPPT
jgi:Ca2+-binding EF-hand superfamily protein